MLVILLKTPTLHHPQPAAPLALPWAPQAIPQAGQRLVELPRSCHLAYDESSDPRVLQLIQQVPEELWGAKLALQVRTAQQQLL